MKVCTSTVAILLLLEACTGAGEGASDDASPKPAEDGGPDDEHAMRGDGGIADAQSATEPACPQEFSFFTDAERPTEAFAATRFSMEDYCTLRRGTCNSTLEEALERCSSLMCNVTRGCGLVAVEVNAGLWASIVIFDEVSGELVGIAYYEDIGYDLGGCDVWITQAGAWPPIPDGPDWTLSSGSIETTDAEQLEQPPRCSDVSVDSAEQGIEGGIDAGTE